MNDEKEYISKEKFNELTVELDHLKKVKRREVAEDLEHAKSLGDLSENAEYQEARQAQAETEVRISKIEAILKNAEIVISHHSTIAEVGSTITIQKEGEGNEKIYNLVGSEEADSASGKISINSPLGTALQGKKAGDAFILSTPSGKMSYKVVNIK